MELKAYDKIETIYPKKKEIKTKKDNVRGSTFFAL